MSKLLLLKAFTDIFKLPVPQDLNHIQITANKGHHIYFHIASTPRRTYMSKLLLLKAITYIFMSKLLLLKALTDIFKLPVPQDLHTCPNYCY